MGVAVGAQSESRSRNSVHVRVDSRAGEKIANS